MKQSLEANLPEGVDILNAVDRVELLPGVLSVHLVTMERVRVYFSPHRITPAQILKAAMQRTGGAKNEALNRAPALDLDDDADELDALDMIEGPILDTEETSPDE